MSIQKEALTRLKLDYAPYSALQQRQILNRIRRSKDVFIDRRDQANRIAALEELLACEPVACDHDIDKESDSAPCCTLCGFIPLP